MTFDEQVRLTIVSVKKTVVFDQEGPRFVHAYQLKTQFRLPGAGRTQRGLIDTGAAFTVLPEAVWRPHERAIERVSASPGQVLPKWLLFVAGLGGGFFPCEPAFVHIQLFDPELRVLKPRRILVKCARDGGLLKESLIGLGGQVLDECRLEIGYSPDSIERLEKQPAWLREA